MKRRTKKQIAMDNAKATIKAAGWKEDSDEAKALMASINKQHEVAKGGSTELKEARNKRNETAATLKKTNKMIKVVRDARKALENAINANNPKDAFERFTTQNDRVVKLGGKSMTLELSYMTDLISPAKTHDDETQTEDEDDKTVSVLVAVEENNEETNEQESPFGV